MSAANSYGGGSTISQGIVAINNQTALGSGAITITGNAAIQLGSSAVSFANDIVVNTGVTLTLQGGNNYTVNGVISGSGNVIKTGASTVILAGANTNNGTLTISQGTVQGDTNSLKTNITNNSSLIFNQSTTGTYSSAISGTGSVSVTGTGTVIWSGTNNYSGGTTISAGTLQGDTNSLQGNMTNNSNITFNMTAFSGVYSGTMSGTGTVTYTNTGSNTTILSGNSNYNGGSIFNNALVTVNSNTGLGTGTISVTDNSTLNSGSSSIAIANNISINSGKTLTIGGNQFIVLNGTISGAGGISISTAKPTFAGTNTSFSGGITVNSGTIFVGNNSGLGTATVTVAGNGAIASTAGSFNVGNNFTLSSGRVLTFGGDNNLTISGGLSGAGGLTVNTNALAVTLLLSGANSYGGNTLVSVGTLKVNGSITSNVSVSSNGTLSGSGAITGNVTVTGGKVVPGGSVGTMTVTGNYSPNSSATLQIEVSPSAASELIVNGTANLNGTLSLVYDSGTYNSTTFDILQATTLNGTFSVVESGKPSTVTSAVNYVGNKIQLVLTATGTASLAQSAGSGLSITIGRFMDNVSAGSPTTQQQQLISALNGITNTDALDNALNQIAPISAQPLQSRNMHISQQQQVNIRLAALRSTAYVAGDKLATHGAWFQPFYTNARQNDYRNLLGFAAQTGGFALGLDKEFRKDGMVGVALSYAYAMQKSLLNAATKSNINNYLAMLYGTYSFKDKVYLDWLLAGGINNYINDRVLQVMPVNVTATSSYVGQQYSAQVILSKRYDISKHYKDASDILNSKKNPKTKNKKQDKTDKKSNKSSPIYVIPQLNADFIYLRTPGYSEQNAGTLGMNVNSSSSSVFTLGAGLQLEKPYIVKNKRLLPEAHALVYYDVKNGNISSNSTFITGGPALNITSSQGRLTGQFGGSISYSFTQQLLIKAEYDLQLKSSYFNNVAFLNLRYIF